MKVSMDIRSLEKQLNNIVEYSFGFLEGAQFGKKIFLNHIGQGIIKGLGQYIDTSAKLNPQALHHVYEWYQTGSPSARLFDLNYTVGSIGLSVNGSFKQSRTVSQDSKVPFYDKARIMENGIPVTIKPKNAQALAFNSAGETVFTKKPVTIKNPGGDAVQNSFSQIFDEFMLRYFKQSFLKASGLYDYISNPVVYKKELNSGSKKGKSKGRDVGFKWITNAKIEVE